MTYAEYYWRLLGCAIGIAATFALSARASDVVVAADAPAATRPAEVRSVVIVIDAGSAEMVQKWNDLRAPAAKLIESIPASARFNLFVLEGEKPRTLAEAQLMPADNVRRQQARTMLEQAAETGQSEPLAAMHRVLQLQPQQIWWVLGRDYQAGMRDALLAAIEARDPGHRIRIDTIAFVTPQEKQGEEFAAARKIAHETGGTHRVVVVGK